MRTKEKIVPSLDNSVMMMMRKKKERRRKGKERKLLTISLTSVDLSKQKGLNGPYIHNYLWLLHVEEMNNGNNYSGMKGDIVEMPAFSVSLLSSSFFRGVQFVMRRKK